MPNGILDTLFTLWFPRCIAPFIGIGFAYGIGLVYLARIRKWEIDARKDIALARLEQRNIVVNKREMATDARPIESSADEITAISGKKIDKKKLVEFVTEALNPGGIGLAIGQWKKREGFNQSDIEDILDYLADLGLCTPRQNGRACEWMRGYKMQEVLRIIADDQRDMEYMEG